jgi:hypothetical protein
LQRHFDRQEELGKAAVRLARSLKLLLATNGVRYAGPEVANCWMC